VLGAAAQLGRAVEQPRGVRDHDDRGVRPGRLVRPRVEQRAGRAREPELLEDSRSTAARSSAPGSRQDPRLALMGHRAIDPAV
jgi:hypothetical protein